MKLQRLCFLPKETPVGKMCLYFNSSGYFKSLFLYSLFSNNKCADCWVICSRMLKRSAELRLYPEFEVKYEFLPIKDRQAQGIPSKLRKSLSSKVQGVN